ncbi:hypothetical protein M8A51_20900 [Schlegelella sp. S2-27]|uniref:Uncharacterized protein n=1 Tax=Caldimonas mangrovi TaxID=2944811 RepID=A0ABT0YUL3_9BURK|nr:hypothetical protein [Caldimonas mangrovi]MCM5681994.1 hypothetical protein [Caldimonas mangrovi]
MTEVHIVVKAELTEIAAGVGKLAPLLAALHDSQRVDGPAQAERQAGIGQGLLDAYGAAGFEFRLTADEDLYGSHRREPWRFPGELVAALRTLTLAERPVSAALPAGRHGQLVLTLEAADDYPDAIGRFYAELLAFCGCRHSRYGLECDEWDCSY